MTHPVEPIIDYARPAMMAETALKNLHMRALDCDYDAAVQHGIEALVETKLAIQNLRLMQEQELQLAKDREDAIRKQTQTV